MNVLVVNAGGVTLELTLVDDHDDVADTTLIDPWDGADTAAIAEFAGGADVGAIGHRVVDGGRHDTPVVIDDDVVAEFERAAEMAPTHQARTLAAIAATRTEFAEVPHVACFDTTFHRTIPDHAATYALPADWRQRWPLRRRGFHGLSHAHVARRAPSLVGAHASERIVSSHLGSGASLCAIDNGRSVDTTMGMTPLDGLVMVERSGSIDPGLLIWLLGDGRLSLDDLDDGLHHHSGLAGLAGGSGDLREILPRIADGDDAARLAFDVYVHRARQGIAAMVTSLGGLDVLAFTGGVGEHVAELRGAIVAGLGHLGVAVDADRNRAVYGADADITAGAAGRRCVVVATGEHHTIAAETRSVTSR